MLRRILASLRANLVAGIVVIIPAALSIWAVYALVSLIDSPLRGMLRNRFGELPVFAAPGVGIVVVLIFIFLVGLLARTFVGRVFLPLGEWFFSRIPVVRTLYLGSKQMLSALLGDGEVGFREVVLVEYPKKNSYVIGFVASRGKGELATVNMEPILNVFVPTAPNPISGMVLLVPESRVKRLHMSIEDAVKFVISSGIVADEQHGGIPMLFETPTSKVTIAEPPEGVHPDIKRITDLIRKREADKDE